MPSPSSITEVVARMEAIVAPLSGSDGIACFTRLYLAVTEGVQKRLAGLGFSDPRFLARLDVVFADLFFAAYDAFQRDPAQTPRAWLPLFEARSRRGIAPLQFALAGPPGSLGFLDRILHRFDRIDDVVAMWNVRRARDAAWTNAETLWTLRGQEVLRSEFMEALDRMVGFAGRGLLVPNYTVIGGSRAGSAAVDSGRSGHVPSPSTTAAKSLHGTLFQALHGPTRATPGPPPRDSPSGRRSRTGWRRAHDHVGLAG